MAYAKKQGNVSVGRGTDVALGWIAQLFDENIGRPEADRVKKISARKNLENQKCDFDAWVSRYLRHPTRISAFSGF